MQRVASNQCQLVLNLCTCGSLHFTYGPITIHLNRDEFLILAEQIAQAAHFLKRPADDSAMEFSSRPPHTTCH